MTTKELAQVVKQMRDTQRAYFKARRSGLPGTAELEDSKRLEKAVDTAVRDILDDHPAMLPGWGGDE